MLHLCAMVPILYCCTILLDFFDVRTQVPKLLLEEAILLKVLVRGHLQLAIPCDHRLILGLKLCQRIFRAEIRYVNWSFCLLRCMRRRYTLCECVRAQREKARERDILTYKEAKVAECV